MKKHTHNNKVQTCRTCECSGTVHHISRIEGQLRTLKEYVAEGKRCEEVALLTTSITKSFDALRIKTLRNFIVNDLLSQKDGAHTREKSLDAILKLYKK